MIARTQHERTEVARFLKMTNETRNAAIAIFQVDVYTQASSMQQYSDILAITRHFAGIRF